MTSKSKTFFGLQIWLILTTVAAIKIAYAFETSYDFDEDQPINICGKAIPETLAFVCETLNSLPVTPASTSKRSQYGEKQLFDFGSGIFDKNGELYEQKDGYKNLIYKPRSIRSFYLSQMYSRGIVRECCINSCSLKKLKNYCAKTRE